MTNKQLAKKLEKPFKKEMKHYAKKAQEEEHSLVDVLKMAGFNETNLKIDQLKGWLKKTIVCPTCLRPTESEEMAGFECIKCDKEREGLL